MQKSIDTIVLFNDTEHQPVERTSRYQKLHSIFQCNGKHFFDINSTINCSLIQNYQRCYVLGTGVQPYHNLLRRFLSLLNIIFSRGIRTTYCLHKILQRVRRHHHCQRTSHPKRQFSWDIFFWKVCWKPVLKLLLFDLLITGKQ